MEERVCVTRHVEFEAAHLLQDYDGRCGSLHGHSYKLEVTVSCPESVRKRNPFNFVMDFKKLDKILDEYVPDHCFMTNVSNGVGTADYAIADIVESYNMRIFKMDVPPSAENMVKVFATELQMLISAEFEGLDYTVDEVLLWETTDSHATWKRG